MGNKQSANRDKKYPFQRQPAIAVLRNLGLTTKLDIECYAKSNCRNDAALQHGICASLLELYEDSHWKPNYFYTSSPVIDCRLDPCDVYQLYKIARFVVKGELRMDVAVLITLWVRSSQCHVAKGETGEKVNPKDFSPNIKYITRKALVAGFQFVGNGAGVDDCARKYNAKNLGVVVSNFDPAFVYVLGHEIEEPEYGKDGLGCKKGIHAFIDPESALAYRNTGFIDYHFSTLISAKFTHPREVDDADLTKITPYSSEKIDPMAHQKEELNVRNTKIMKPRQFFLRELHRKTQDDEKVLPMEKIIKRLFGDWYFNHNWNLDPNMVQDMAERHGTEEKKVPLPKQPLPEHEKNCSPELEKVPSAPELENPKLDPTLEKVPSAPEEVYVPEGSVLLLQTQEAPYVFEPRIKISESPHPPLETEMQQLIRSMPNAPEHELEPEVDERTPLKLNFA